MKIELKKFQKLIENRIKRKNALLQNDVKRTFPMCHHGQDPLKDNFNVYEDKKIAYMLISPKEQEQKLKRQRPGQTKEAPPLLSSLWKFRHEKAPERQ